MKLRSMSYEFVTYPLDLDGGPRERETRTMILLRVSTRALSETYTTIPMGVVLTASGCDGLPP